MQALPLDIRNLPRYYIPKQLFICTGIILVLFLVWSLIMFFIWIWRTRKHIHNYQYIVDHNIRREFEHAKKTLKQNLGSQKQEENQVLESQTEDQNATQYTPQIQLQQLIYNRQQSRILEFICLSVIVVININAFVCTIMQTAAFLTAVTVYLLFNVIKIVDNQKLRLLFFIPLIVAYVPFFIFSKEIKQF